MGMMLPCIKINYHAYNPEVDSILFSFTYNIQALKLQEDNDQAFPISL